MRKREKKVRYLNGASLSSAQSDCVSWMDFKSFAAVPLLLAPCFSLHHKDTHLESVMSGTTGRTVGSIALGCGLLPTILNVWSE